MTAPVRAAVVGCGDISAVHLAALRDLDGVELVGVCDVDAARAQATADAQGTVAYTDHREMLDSLRPDVVHVCTPHDQHAPVAVDCIARGVHVILEKPVAHTLADARPVLDAHLANPAVKVAVCFQNRYNRASQEAYRLIHEGLSARSGVRPPRLPGTALPSTTPAVRGAASVDAAAAAC